MALKQDFAPKRRRLLQYLGLGGAAALAAAVTTSAAKTSSEESALQVTRLAAYYNAASDWMAWVQVMNENTDPHQVGLNVYNLAGELIYNTTLSLNPYQTQTVPLESLAGIKGKQGMVVLSSAEHKKLAACLVQRRASQPDYTSSITSFSPTSFSSS